MSFTAHLDKDARLRILQALAKQTDGRLSDRMLVEELDNWGHRRALDPVRTQMRALVALGAVALVVDTDAVMVAELTRAGQDHVTRRVFVDGVRRPEPGE